MRRARRKASVDGPTDVSIILERVLKGPEFKGKLDDAILVNRWAEVVGEQVASKVKILDFKEGVLLLHAESSAWRSEVNFAKKAILDRSNALLGKPIAKELRFV